MNSVVWLLTAACIGGIHAAPSLPPLPVNPGGIGGLFRGPNQETIIRGPDGSEITSDQLGGAVQLGTKLEPIVVPDQIPVSSVTISPAEDISVTNNIESASASPVVISEHSEPSPYVLSIDAGQLTPKAIASDIPISRPTVELVNGPEVVASAEKHHIIETELVDAPEVEPNQSSDLNGPSGSISVRGSTSIVSGPASTTISEPVRKIPITAVASASLAAPSTLLLPPALSPLDSSQNNIASTALSTVEPSQDDRIFLNHQLLSQLLPPTSPSNTQVHLSSPSVESPLDLKQTQTISSPSVDASQQNVVDLSQTIIPNIQRSLAPQQNVDIDIRRINLIPTNIQQVTGIAVGESGHLSSTPSSISLGHNIISFRATVDPASSTEFPQVSIQNVDINQPSRPLFTEAALANNLPTNMPPNLSLSSPNYITTPNERISSQDQSIGTNQIVSNIPGITQSTNLNYWNDSTGAPPIDPALLKSRVNIEQDYILPSSVTPPVAGSNLGPISTLLNTVLVQPTDPRNREVIEFGGKQLENVGNIVPVIHHPLIVAGGLAHIQQIPTASVSQLASGNALVTKDYSGQERLTKRHN